jgi:hypothetical protein
MKALLLIALATLMGCIGCFGAYWVATRIIPSGQWEAVATLPEKPKAILADGPNGVYVVAASGNVYVCRRSDTCEVIMPKQLDIFGASPCIGFHSAAPQAPGEVLDIFERCPAGLGHAQIKYILLTDGSIWTWSKFDGEFEIVFILASAIVGALIALVACVGYLSLKRRHARHKVDNDGIRPAR